MMTNTRLNSPATQNRVHGMDRTYATQKDPQIAVIDREPCWVRYPENTKLETQNKILPQLMGKTKNPISFQAESYQRPYIFIPPIPQPVNIN